MATVGLWRKDYCNVRDDYDHDDCDRMILPEDYFRVPDKSVGRLIDWLIKIRIMVMLMMIL